MERFRRAVVSGRGLFVALVAVIALSAAFWVNEAGASTKGVLKIRFGGDAHRTRVVIELDQSVRGRLTSDADATDTVILALPGAGVAGDMDGRGTGLVKSWRLDEAAGAARLRLDLNRESRVARRFLLPPADGIAVYRYVLDLEAVGAPPASRTASAPGPRPAAANPVSTEPAPKADPAPRPRARPVVVIDAGHGGRDPGASGVEALEKDVTLAAARSLKARLERSGRYRVVLTRETDAHIQLEDRVSIARRAGADLFISLHADAGTEPGLRGASVYTLSERGSDRAARQVMTRSDWLRDVALPGDDPEVNRILLDLTQRATRNRSAMFARTLLEQVGEHAPLLQRSHRDAGFVVLLAPDVPAVLLEMGFLTNREDERMLTDPRRRDRLMGAVADAIDAYFAQDARTAAVAASP